MPPPPIPLPVTCLRPVTPLSTLTLPTDVDLTLSDILAQHKREDEVCGESQALLICLRDYLIRIQPAAKP